MNDQLTHRLDELKRPSPDYPRHYIPVTAELSTWEQIEPYYTELLSRPLNSVQDVEKWIADQSELGSVIGEEGSRRYIKMTCATDDSAIERSYLDFVEHIQPNLSALGFKLSVRLLDCPFTASLDREKYGILLRSVKNSVELFREENIPLETEISKLSQQYQKTVGAMTVQFQGEEMTLPQLSRFLQSDNRAIRQEAFELSAARRLQDADKLDDLFDALLKLRLKVAQNAGFDSYIDYQFRAYERFDYTPANCHQFHASIEKWVMPLVRKLTADRKRALKLDTIKPWDTSCDRLGRPPLKPFTTTRQLANGCYRIFNRIDPELGANFKKMIDMGLLDLDSRKGKAPGGYQSSLNEVRLPFIFMNAVGMNGDVFTLLHEGGHAFHQFGVKDQPLERYRSAPMEFCEVASMTMEHLAAPYLDEFYNRTDSARAWRDTLEGDMALLPWIAIIDAFQHWIYSNPEHTQDERANAWISLMERFGSGVDWTGYEDALKYRWIAQLHIFEYPFYYIEYGIALLGALQIWRNSLTNQPKAVQAYKYALTLGGSKTLPELFAAADIRFDFTDDTIRPLMQTIQTEVEKVAKVEEG